MLRKGFFIPMVVFTLLMSVVSTSRAVKTPDMPSGFGTDEWAVSHYREAVDYLKYVARKDIQNQLLSVPENLRLEAWNEFWKPFDPVRSTADNEFRTEYFRRIRYANENFGSILQPGWLTDRGEAYVRMGEPSSIERYAMRAGGRDLYIWVYINTAHEVDLYFVDRTGVGDFDLLNPQDMIEEAFVYGR